MPKKKKPVAKKATKRAPVKKSTPKRSAPAKRSTPRKPTRTAPTKRNAPQRRESASQAAISRRRAALGVTPRTRKNTPKPARTTRGKKLTAVQKAKAALAATRARSEAGKRGAITRKKGQKGIKSAARRATRARVKYREFGFTFQDVLTGRNPSKQYRRDQFDAEFAPFIGKSVQVSFGVTGMQNGKKMGWTRIRRTFHDFTGRLDVASVSHSVTREAMRQLNSKWGMYITSVSVQVLY